MKAIVNKELCIGCGVCCEVCPAVFQMGQDGKSEVKVDVVPPTAADACRNAALQCPVEAITILGDPGKA